MSSWLQGLSSWYLQDFRGFLLVRLVFFVILVAELDLILLSVTCFTKDWQDRHVVLVRVVWIKRRLVGLKLRLLLPSLLTRFSFYTLFSLSLLILLISGWLFLNSNFLHLLTLGCLQLFNVFLIPYNCNIVFCHSLHWSVCCHWLDTLVTFSYVCTYVYLWFVIGHNRLDMT